ncbi:Rhs family protein [Aquitalea magnusonii]|uniref:Rhs family protein n=1 Tax=Aquitalea magnusonii TaxID=332411 RepID=A0A3G9GIZ0_9NEIS|nr:RHS repeat-associated core domain-containing protein [Aquitalea magnusonii]BBF86241.1 Rhs family protein [Aquitalea magnusonii]
MLNYPSSDSTEYRYDPLGRRIAKLSQGKTTLYGWDGDVLAFETQDDAAVHYLFEPGSFIPLAQVHTDAIQGVKVPAWNQYNPYDPERDPLLQAGPEPSAPRAVYYYHADHLGTPQALTDAQGQLALEMDYQAWGEAREVIAEVAASAGIRNPLRFQGQYHDDESGLHYNRYRYYDPEIGRFISRDPIGLLGDINIHSYAPNPVGWIDPLGLARCPCNPCSKYDVGPYDELKRRSASGDNLDIHHAMQKHPASQVVVGYDPKTAPSIAVPAGEHEQIPTRKGVYTGTARDLLASDIRDLRKHTGASNECLQRLISLNKEMYPAAFKK